MNDKGKRKLKAVSLTLSLALLLSSASSLFPFSGNKVMAANVDDWPEVSGFLQNMSGVYMAPSTIPNSGDFTPDGPIMGNGDMKVVLVGDTNQQKFSISESDMWTDGPSGIRAITTGGITIGPDSNKPAPSATGTFRQEQDILNAKVTATSQSNFKTVTYVSATENTMVTELSTDGTASIPMAVDIWAKADNQAAFPSTAGIDSTTGILWATRTSNGGSGARWTTRNAIASTIQGASVTETTDNLGKSTATFTLVPGTTVKIYTVLKGGKNATTHLADAKARAGQLNDTIVAGLKTAHLDWWKQFWLKSYVRTYDDQLDKYYYGALYQFGSINRAGFTPAGQYPFCLSDFPGWQGDFHLNQEYLGQNEAFFVGNRPELSDGVYQPLLDYMPQGRSNAQSRGEQGILYQVGLAPWGTLSDNFYGDQVLDASYSGALLIWNYYYNQDLNWLRTQGYPYIKALGDYWVSHLGAKVNGKYVDYGSTNEHSYGRNPILDLALIKFVMKALLTTSQDLGVDANMRPTWQDIYDNISDYPTVIQNGKRVFVGNEAKTSYHDYTDLELIYPAEQISISSPQNLKDIAFNSLDLADYSTTKYGIFGNKVGYPIDTLVSNIKSKILNVPLENWHGLRQNNTIGGLHINGEYMEFIQSAMLQSQEDYIRIFPNWYTNKAAKFKRLRAKGAFLVDADITSSGVIQNVNIVSEQGKPVSVMNPWPNHPLQVTNNGVPVATTNNGGVYTFNTSAGNSYALTPGPSSITLNQTQATVEQNQTLQLTAQVMPSDANEVVTWSSSNPTVATVDGNGLVTGKTGGTVIITASTADGKIATSTVTIPTNLMSIPSPTAVTAYGAAKTAAALGLPDKVSLVTNAGNVDASVTWDVSSTSYDPTKVTEQTFTVTGTVTLVPGVLNPNNVPLTTSISVTVNPAQGIPGRIEAENYVSMSGIQTENSSEGTKDVGWTDSGDWMDYVVNVQKSALYKVDYRVAVNSGTGIVNFLVDGVSNKITSLPSTGGFQTWKTVSDKVTLSAGKHTIRLAINTGGWNLNWFELSEVPPTNLTSITAPAAITGVDIGTAKTAAALGLPVNAVLVTESGNMDASVNWDLSGISYNPTTMTGQTFTVPGTVTLPSVVSNPNNVPLTTSVSVTVNKIPSSQITATADSSCSGSETADKAVDGILTGNSKWCSKSSNRWLQLDLGSLQSVNAFIIKHASAGGESATFNTKAYNIQVSSDGTNWSTVVNVANNTNGITIDSIAAVSARYIKLNVTTPTQTSDPAARIYEFQVLKAPSLDKTLKSITTPAAITGVVNGTAKTAAALGLPATTELVTDTGSMNVDVTWNVDGSSYDPAVRTQQTFTVSGTVTLPAGVVNPSNVALTTSVSVTVLPAPATPKSTLTGVQQVLSGQTFTLTMGLSDVTQSVYQQVYAQDLTLSYDPASVQFDSVTSLKDGFQVIDKKETAPGQLRIVVATVGANVPAQGDLLAIQFKAKSVTQATNTTISVDHVKIANGQGNELQVGGASREVQITVPAIPVDKSLLNATITSAQAKYDAAVEGNGDGLYAIGSKAQLQSAINAAKVAVNNSNATQQQVDSAKAALEAAIQVFESMKITADINGGGVSIGDLAVVAAAYGKQQGQVGWNEKADVNHDGKVDIVDLAIVAKAILQ